MQKDIIYRQAAVELAMKYCPDDDGTVQCEGDIRGLLDELENLPSAQPEQRWIPCSERLPENEYVIISKKPTMISGDKWSVAIAIRMTDPRSGKIQWRDTGFGVIQEDKVLAWMPLPASYKGE